MIWSAESLFTVNFNSFRKAAMKEFKDRVAVITGAASGIGRALAERCASEGMKVVLADINEDNLAKVEAQLKGQGAAVISVRTDVSKREDVEALAKKTIDTFGAVHLLVNNAGIGAGGSAWDSTWNDWEWVMGVNLWGVIYGCKIFAPLMLAQKEPCHIVNTSSVAGLVAFHPSAAYHVTKHAVVALSENLQLALEKQQAPVKVSVLCPGWVKTGILDSKRNRPEHLQNPGLRPRRSSRRCGRRRLQHWKPAWRRKPWPSKFLRPSRRNVSISSLTRSITA